MGPIGPIDGQRGRGPVTRARRERTGARPTIRGLLDTMSGLRTVDASDAAAAVLDEIYATHFTHWTRLAYLIVGRADVAEELVQESILRCLPRLGSLEHPHAYVRTAVVNAAKRWWGRQQLEQRTLERVAPSQLRDPDADGDLGLSLDTDESIASLLDRLPARQRAIVVLRYFEDMSERDVAATLGVPVGTIKSSLHRALHALRIGAAS